MASPRRVKRKARRDDDTEDDDELVSSPTKRQKATADEPSHAASLEITIQEALSAGLSSPRAPPGSPSVQTRRSRLAQVKPQNSPGRSEIFKRTGIITAINPRLLSESGALLTPKPKPKPKPASIESKVSLLPLH